MACGRRGDFRREVEGLSAYGFCVACMLECALLRGVRPVRMGACSGSLPVAIRRLVVDRSWLLWVASGGRRA